LRQQSGVASTEDFENSKEVNLYPNPAPNGHFWLVRLQFMAMLDKLSKNSKVISMQATSYPIGQPEIICKKLWVTITKLLLLN
jgi:hypothetical protein